MEMSGSFARRGPLKLFGGGWEWERDCCSMPLLRASVASTRSLASLSLRRRGSNLIQRIDHRFGTLARKRTSAVTRPTFAMDKTVLVGREAVDRLFGPWTISRNEVFAESPLSFAFVNLKPVVPGHVLVAPKRVVKRFGSLTNDEVADLWQLAKVSR